MNTTIINGKGSISFEVVKNPPKETKEEPKK
jgi:hypothetical protein